MADDWTLDDARAVVAKVQQEMGTEHRVVARRIVQVLERMSHEGRVSWATGVVRRQSEDRAALDYAETRLSEMQAQLLELADGYDVDSCDPMPVATSRMLLAVAEKLRAVARG